MAAVARRMYPLLLGLILCAARVAPAQQPPKLRLSEVQAVQPDFYRVDLNLDPAKNTFTGAIQIRLNVEKPFRTLWLNASKLSLTTIKLEKAGSALNGTSIAGNDNFIGLSFPAEVSPGTADLKIEYTGQIKFGQPSGIFGSEDNGNRYLLTQFESIDARSAFPCFDEPSYKVPWQLTLHVPASDSAISNTPIEKESTEGQNKTVIFEQTKPLPSYLVAFGVGPFEYVNAGTAGRNHVPVRIVTPKGRAAEAQYAAEVTATLLTRLENYFGIDYPYKKADQVAMPISVGLAMENPGMVTYGASIILAKPQSDLLRRQRSYAEVAAHELAHQWFGDFVTTAWWNDIWLNEAFATWMEGKLIAEWKPEWHTRAIDTLDYARAERDDSFPSARSIRQAIESNDDIDNAFDSITYEKGAAVIGMFENWIGPAKFQQGVRAYLNAHAFQTATTSDFLAAVSEAGGQDVRSAFSTFTDQPGIPVVKVALRCAAGSAPTLTLEQDRFSLLPARTPDTQHWSIPVCVRSEAAGQTGTHCTLLNTKAAEMPLPGDHCPAWVEANANASGYYRVAYADNLLSELTAGDPENRLEPQERVNVVYDADAAAHANLLPYGDALALAARFRNDPVYPAFLGALGLATGVSANLVPPDSASGYERYLAKTLVPRAREIGWTPRPGESPDDALIRTSLLATASTLAGDQTLAKQGRQLATRWIAGDHSLPSEIILPALRTEAFYGDVSTAREYVAAVKKTTDLQDRQQIVFAMGAFRDPLAIQTVLQALLSRDIPSSYSISLLMGNSSSEAARKVSFEFLKSHYSAVVNQMFPLERSFLPNIGDLFCDEQTKQDFRSFFDSKLNDNPEMRRTVAQVLEKIDGCIITKQFQQPSLSAYLKTQ